VGECVENMEAGIWNSSGASKPLPSLIYGMIWEKEKEMILNLLKLETRNMKPDRKR
jgi:hypothetical protein